MPLQFRQRPDPAPLRGGPRVADRGRSLWEYAARWPQCSVVRPYAWQRLSRQLDSRRLPRPERRPAAGAGPWEHLLWAGRWLAGGARAADRQSVGPQTGADPVRDD